MERSANKCAWRPSKNPTAFTSATFVLAAVAACDKKSIIQQLSNTLRAVSMDSDKNKDLETHWNV